MKDYALSRATAFEQSGGGGFTRLWRNWQARRALTAMTHFDDHMLRDIGVCREDLVWAAGLPLTSNAAEALEERGASRYRRRDA